MAVHYKEIFNEIIAAEMGPKGYFRKGARFCRYVPETHMIQTLYMQMGHSGRTFMFYLGTDHLCNPMPSYNGIITIQAEEMSYMLRRSFDEKRKLMLDTSPTYYLSGKEAAFSEENFTMSIYNNLSVMREDGIEKKILDITTDEEYYQYVKEFMSWKRDPSDPEKTLSAQPAIIYICFKTGRMDQATEAANRLIQNIACEIDEHNVKYKRALEQKDLVTAQYLLELKKNADYDHDALTLFLDRDYNEYEKLCQNRIAYNHGLLQAYFGKNNPHRTAE